MREVEFRVPPSAQFIDIESTIESICAAEGLQIGMKSALASFPGSTHWHFKRSKERGTLEITLLPSRRRIWAQIQDGRRADWIDACLAKITRAVEGKLKESTRLGRKK
jgi:hypothetical protein